MTLGTGAVGLNNLSVANNVHIVEPQWNPAVENQAIARILRLDQQRPVTVFRYIMAKSVEKSVQTKQLRKLQLASGGFGFAKDEDPTKKVQQIMDLLCPKDDGT
jgi:SWI/SNF-related matrix-associated actin-dependent regulator of chromatin subfamily A3